jgi:hypothetical protein
MNNSKSKILFPFCLLVITIFNINHIYCQEPINLDTTKVVISIDTISQKELKTDSITSHEKDSPLDIQRDRGLFIQTPARDMMLRIIGSVRFLTLFDNNELETKKSFNSYEIPTGDENERVPNYFNSLEQTRMGFEVTRNTKIGKTFIRIETDFAGTNSLLRLRHAYGKVRNFLIGQTWSLFSNVSSLPTTVSSSGPNGVISIRTPQIRYTDVINNKTKLFLALEYSLPDFVIPDSVSVSSVQTVPDFTFSIDKHGKKGKIQYAGVISTIALKDSQNKLNHFFGFGGAISGTWYINKSQNIYFQAAYGNAIAHYISILNGKGQDIAFNSEQSKFDPLSSYGGFVSYGKYWKNNMAASISCGVAGVINKDYQPGNSYRNSFAIYIDYFLEIISGARTGIEYAAGMRYDKDSTKGYSSRIAILFYYDF